METMTHNKPRKQALSDLDSDRSVNPRAPLAPQAFEITLSVCMDA